MTTQRRHSEPNAFYSFHLYNERYVIYFERLWNENNEP